MSCAPALSALHGVFQAKQEAASQREQAKALTEQLAKAERLQRDQAEAAEARVRDLTGAVEEAQVR